MPIRFSGVWGDLQIPRNSDPKKLTHDEAEQKAVENDRLFHTKGTPRFYTEMVREMEKIRSSSLKMTVPILFQVPEADAVVSFKATKEVFNNLYNPNKKMITYPGYFHEIFNEPDLGMVHPKQICRNRPFEDLKQWLIKLS